ncbi:uridine 5'-monophosphate synthase-like [Hoplias malabaricus]|uniref:uridine 5'-monophosphate synthase-like n=1 Tax=Hoplias malabaricus TaxID=27720 RepID=UPI0034629665
MEDVKKLLLELHDLGAVKLGEFKLRSGLLSPIYFDLRKTVFYPDLVIEVSRLLYKHAKEAEVKFDCVCGVPYTALPLATVISTTNKCPMLIRRKEPGDYGEKQIEGVIKAGDVCLIVEDVVTSGSSVLETARLLEKEGLKVKDAVVLLDREQGGRHMLESEGITLHPVFTISTLLDVLLDAGRIDPDTRTSVKTFIEGNQTFTKPPGNSSLRVEEEETKI